jgi:hypothetical protein
LIVAELIGTNLGQDLTAQGMQLVNALWDNRDQIDPIGTEEGTTPLQDDDR